MKNEIGDRMKKYYENVGDIQFTRRIPLIIRVDGKSFHTFSKNFERPYDHVLMEAMQKTMLVCCASFQGCVFGYCQSDEISFLLLDDQTLESQAWFDYKQRKIVSIASAIATNAFRNAFINAVIKYCVECGMDEKNAYEAIFCNIEKRQYNKLLTAYMKGAREGCVFDARAFTIPKEEVANYFYWRQIDATRNSIQMAGQANFSHKALQGKSCNEIQEMLFQERGINWNNYSAFEKRGACCYKKDKCCTGPKGDFMRSAWHLDEQTPIFTGENRGIIECWLWPEKYTD